MVVFFNNIQPESKVCINSIIIWLQQYACSDWLFSCNDWALFSCNDWALLARCPKHIQFVFNLIVDIHMDSHVMVNNNVMTSL